ncbi:MAG: PHP domain-containing protein [Bdellovibrionota bacterium]
MFLADFHTHTNLSDGKIPMRELVDLYGERGFGAMAITDHVCETRTIVGKAARFLGHTLTEETFPAYIAQVKAEADRAWHKYQMLVIPGFEISLNSPLNHRSAHMLALGVEEWVNPNQDIPLMCREIRAKGGLAIAAHPVSTRKWEKQTYLLWDRREELREEFDAWEVASGPFIFDEVLNSGLPMLASSDLHHPKQMKSWKTVLHCDRNVPAVLSAIRRQEISFSFYADARLTAPSMFSFSPIRRALSYAR